MNPIDDIRPGVPQGSQRQTRSSQLRKKMAGEAFLSACSVVACMVEGQTVHSEDTQAGRDSGRPTQQINDIKSLIAAARNDSRCNGKLGILGGSSGATHAAWAAIDQTHSDVWPVWDKTLRPDAVACLSGAYDFADRVGSDITIMDFKQKVEN